MIPPQPSDKGSLLWSSRAAPRGTVLPHKLETAIYVSTTYILTQWEGSQVSMR